jgi:hypothetical protein
MPFLPCSSLPSFCHSAREWPPPHSLPPSRTLICRRDQDIRSTIQILSPPLNKCNCGSLFCMVKTVVPTWFCWPHNYIYLGGGRVLSPSHILGDPHDLFSSRIPATDPLRSEYCFKETQPGLMTARGHQISIPHHLGLRLGLLIKSSSCAQGWKRQES